MNKEMSSDKCPKCNKVNNDNWPITVNGEVVEGGCQDCWEAESDKAWWARMEQLEKDYEKWLSSQGVSLISVGKLHSENCQPELREICLKCNNEMPDSGYMCCKTCIRKCPEYNAIVHGCEVCK